MTEQRPPYEDVEPAVSTRKLPPVIDSPPIEGRPSKLAVPAPLPPEPQPTWTEARILRLVATFVATLFIVGFVVAAARACPLWLAWAPFLVGALPYLAFAWMSWRKHLEDESSSRERREVWQQSRLDVLPLADMDADTERYR